MSKAMQSVVSATVTTDAEGKWGTGGICPPFKKKKVKVTGIVAWIVRTFKSDYHLSLNPPKGIKRVKKVKEGVKYEEGNE